MEKIEERTYGYQLYKDKDDYFLSVLAGTVGVYSIEIELTDEEKSTYASQGVAYIDQLAGNITQFPSAYRTRQLPREHYFYSSHGLTSDELNLE